MRIENFIVRQANSNEFKAIGKLLVEVYSSLQGFPNQEEQPKYYERLANIDEFTNQPNTELLIAVNKENEIAGAVVYFSDMKYYGSGGIATTEKNASGFRLLAVNNSFRKKGIGKLLSIKCIDKARELRQQQVIIHSTKSMQVAWKMYEKLGFNRSEDLDFMQGELEVFGFRLLL